MDNTNEVLKATALLYFQQALLNQAYEECATLVTKAKAYGALQSDISNIIAQYLSGDKPIGREAQLGKNRLNGLLKEKK